VLKEATNKDRAELFILKRWFVQAGHTVETGVNELRQILGYHKGERDITVWSMESRETTTK